LGDVVQVDHIPSGASLIKAEEARLGRKLEADERSAVLNNGGSMIVPTDAHRGLSETYGGRNNQRRQAFDAANPVDAINSNAERYRQTLRNQGFTDTQINGQIQKLRDLNANLPKLPGK
jgi:hypothetical protein